MPGTSLSNGSGPVAIWADGLANKEAHTAAYRRLIRDIMDGTAITEVLYLGNFLGPGASPVECVEFLQDPTRFVDVVADSRGELHSVSKKLIEGHSEKPVPTIEPVVAGKYERGFCAAIEGMGDNAFVPEFKNEEFRFAKKKRFEEEVKPALESHVRAFFGEYKPKVFSKIVHGIVDAMRAGEDPDGVYIVDGVNQIALTIRNEEDKHSGLGRKLAEMGRDAESHGSIDPSFGASDIRVRMPTSLNVFDSFLGLSSRGKRKLVYDPGGMEFIVTTLATNPDVVEKLLNNYPSVKRGLYAYAYLLFHSGMLPGEDGKPADNMVTNGDRLEGVYLCNDSPLRPGSGDSLEPDSPEFQRDFANFIGQVTEDKEFRHGIIAYANTGRYGVIHDYADTGRPGDVHDKIIRSWVNVGSLGSYVERGKGVFTVLNPRAIPDAPQSIARDVAFKYDFETSESKRRSMLRKARG